MTFHLFDSTPCLCRLSTTVRREAAMYIPWRRLLGRALAAAWVQRSQAKVESDQAIWCVISLVCKCHTTREIQLMRPNFRSTARIQARTGWDLFGRLGYEWTNSQSILRQLINKYYLLNCTQRYSK